MTRVAEGAGRQPESAGQVGGAAVPRGRVKTSQFTAAVGHINHAHPAFVTGTGLSGYSGHSDEVSSF